MMAASIKGMKIEVVLLPEHLSPGMLRGKTAVIFDVLRATSTMTAALAAGVREIRLFASVEDVLRAAPEGDPGRVRCGERRCLRPEGFELGNSPGGFDSSHRGKIVYMATTNGTKAILAAREASVRIAGAAGEPIGGRGAGRETWARCRAAVRREPAGRSRWKMPSARGRWRVRLSPAAANCPATSRG